MNTNTDSTSSNNLDSLTSQNDLIQKSHRSGLDPFNIEYTASTPSTEEARTVLDRCLKSATKKIKDILIVKKKTATTLTSALKITQKEASPTILAAKTVLYTFNVPPNGQVPDLIICVSTKKDSLGDAAAAAATAIRNSNGETGRPVLGVLHIDTAKIPASKEDEYGYINFLVHQIFHILGFSKGQFSRWEGEYYTGKADTAAQKISSASDNILTETQYLGHTFHTIRTVNAVSSFKEYYGENPPLPKFIESNHGPYENLTIPNGPELQTLYTSDSHAPTDPKDYTSHLTQRVYYTEVMSEWVQNPSYITPISLSLLFDTGWYSSPKAPDPTPPEKDPNLPVNFDLEGEGEGKAPQDPPTEEKFVVESPRFGMITHKNGTLQLPAHSPPGFAVNQPVIAFQSEGLDKRFYWLPDDTNGLGTELQTYTKTYSAFKQSSLQHSLPSLKPEIIHTVEEFADFGTQFGKEWNSGAGLFQYVEVFGTLVGDGGFRATVWVGKNTLDGAFYPEYLGNCRTELPTRKSPIDFEKSGDQSFPVLSVMTNYFNIGRRDNPTAVCVPFVLGPNKTNLYMSLNATNTKNESEYKTAYFNCSTFGDNAFVVPDPKSLSTYVRCPHNVAAVIQHLSDLSDQFDEKHQGDPEATKPENPYIGNITFIKDSTPTWDGQFDRPTIIEPVDPGPQTTLEWIIFYWNNYQVIAIVVVVVVALAVIFGIIGCCFCCFCKHKNREVELDGKQRLRAIATSSEGSLDEETTSSGSGSGVQRKSYRV